MLNGIKTYIGIGIAAIAAISDAVGLNLPVGEVESGINYLFEGIGLLIAAYGRWDRERRAPE